VPLYCLAFQDKVQISADLWVQDAQPLFLLGAGASAIVVLTRWCKQSGRSEALVSNPIGGQRILGQTLSGQVDLYPVAILQDFDPLARETRHPIIVALKSGIAVLIGAPLMNLLRRRQMGRQLA
jgi:hypothetical protein